MIEVFNEYDKEFKQILKQYKRDGNINFALIGLRGLVYMHANRTRMEIESDLKAQFGSQLLDLAMEAYSDSGHINMPVLFQKFLIEHYSKKEKKSGE